MLDLGKVAREVEDSLGSHSSREPSIAAAESKRLKKVLENQGRAVPRMSTTRLMIFRTLIQRCYSMRWKTICRRCVEPLTIVLRTLPLQITLNITLYLRDRYFRLEAVQSRFGTHSSAFC
jgi:hypothetical protein